MRVGNIAKLLFAAVLAAIGTIDLVYRDFALQWQPVPVWVPHRPVLAIASGVFFVACALGLVSRSHKMLAMTFATLSLIFWVAILQGPHVLAAPLSIGAWLGFAETLAVLAASLIVLASVSHEPVSLIRFARVLFGLACVEFGLSHFAYAAVTATMVPAWLPDRLIFAYLTGAGHCAAGLAILSGRLSRLGATLEAAMMSGFVALVHIPGVVHAPHDRLQWTMLVFAFALAGSAWVIAGSLGERAWLKFKPV